jgi:hypothetical protein
MFYSGAHKTKTEFTLYLQYAKAGGTQDRHSKYHYETKSLHLAECYR